MLLRTGRRASARCSAGVAAASAASPASRLTAARAAGDAAWAPSAPRLSTAAAAASAASAASSAPAASVPASAVRALRELTGAPMVECKAALVASGGVIEGAVDALRKRGLAVAAKKAGRPAAQGLVAARVGPSYSRGALVELNSETDFVSRNAAFIALAGAAADAALLALPSGAGGAGAAPGAAAPGGAEAAAALVRAAPGPPGAGTATVGDAVVALVGSIRENLVLRRAVALAAPPGGLVVSYTHAAVAPGAGSIGVLLALEPRPGGEALITPVLVDLARRVAMHVAAARPLYTRRADVPPAALARERAVLDAVGAAEGKTGDMLRKVTEGRLAKFYADVCLEEQAFVLPPAAPGHEGALPKAVGRMVEAASANAGSPARLAGFVTLVVGEGVDKEAAAGAAGGGSK